MENVPQPSFMNRLKQWNPLTRKNNNGQAKPTLWNRVNPWQNTVKNNGPTFWNRINPWKKPNGELLVVPGNEDPSVFNNGGPRGVNNMNEDPREINMSQPASPVNAAPYYEANRGGKRSSSSRKRSSRKRSSRRRSNRKNKKSKRNRH